MRQNPEILNLIKQIQNCQSLVEFETICLPFELIDAITQTCASTFTPEVLKHLSETEPETLESWAIALSKTLGTQFKLLNSWQPLLDSFPICRNRK